MKKAYEIFKKLIPYVIVGAVITTIFGIVAYGLNYNKATSTFIVPEVCSLLFIGFLAVTVGYVIFFSIKSRHLHITKIRKNSNFLKLTSWLTAAVLVLLFIFETAKLIAEPYIEDATGFNAWRVIRYILTLPFAAYFIIEAFPKKIKKTKINFPNWLRYTLSICAILWCVSGLLSIYFSDFMTTTNVIKNFQIILYLVFSVFFVFEGKFEHLKPNNVGYLITSLLSFVLSMGLGLSTIISLAAGFISTYKCCSEIELTTYAVIGIYALSRVFAILSTMKHVIDHDETGSYSRKFNKGLDDFADEPTTINEATEKNVSSEEQK